MVQQIPNMMRYFGLLCFSHCVLSQNVYKSGSGRFPSVVDLVEATNDRSQTYKWLSNQGSSHMDPSMGTFNTVLNVGEKAFRAVEDLQRNQYNISSQCLDHFNDFLEGLKALEDWALRMLDAMGKPGSGLMDFQVQWLGSWEECVDVRAVVYGNPNNKTDPTYPYTGQYCLASFPLGGNFSMGIQGSASQGLGIGLCLPSSCSTADATGLIQMLESLLSINMTDLPEPVLQCQPVTRKYTAGQITVLIVCGIFIALMAAASLYDLVYIQSQSQGTTEKIERDIVSNEMPSTNAREPGSNDTPSDGHIMDEETPPFPSTTSVASTRYMLQPKPTKPTQYKPGRLGIALLSFSVVTNGSKLLSTRQPAGTLTAVNGVRFFSMTWVILGHTYATGIYTIGNGYRFIPKLLKRLTFQAIGNGTYSTDSFFVLSGLLVAYLSLREMKKLGGISKFPWGMFYFHRFWRLTPPYMLVLMVYACLMSHFADGPLWPVQPIEPCAERWWTNLLYINNFIHPDTMCCSWSWYLANDMQFFLISPVMLIPLYYSPLWGSLSCLALVLVTFITSGVLSRSHNLSSDYIIGAVTGGSFMDLYYKPYCRVGAYAVGVYTGYLLYKTDCKVKMPKFVNAIGWTVATVLALLVLYGLWSPDNDNTVSLDTSALYNATSRTVWSACVCWVLFACATGYGGPVNTLLSWPALVPLSRLTYCAYLVHPVLMLTYFFSLRDMPVWYDLFAVVQFSGLLTLTYAIAFATSLAFESPMMGLEKAIFKRNKT